MRLSATPTTSHRAPPVLGEHTGEVLRELRYEPDRIRDLAQRGVVRCA